MYSCIYLSLYPCISVLQYFSITVFQYLSIEFACFRYRNMYTCIPTALFNTYLHIPVFPFSGITVFPHFSISSLPYLHTIGHSERQMIWFSQAMQHSPSCGINSVKMAKQQGACRLSCLALLALPRPEEGMRISKQHTLQISYSSQATGDFTAVNDSHFASNSAHDNGMYWGT